MQGDSENAAKSLSIVEDDGSENPDILSCALKSLPEGEILLDLSYSSVNFMPDSFSDSALFLQFLYLQGNNLKELSSTFFVSFPVLKRLDLRFNKLMSLPESIGEHKFLEVLLLQDNKIKALPKDLGKLTCLRRLQLSGNPIIWPPTTIVSCGLEAIKSFLCSSTEQQSPEEQIAKRPLPMYEIIETDGERSESESLQSKYSSKNKVVNRKGTLHSMEMQRSLVNKASSYKKQSEEIANTRCFNGKRLDREEGSSHQKGEGVQSQSQGKQKQRKRGWSGHALAVIKGKRFPLGYSKRSCNFSGHRIYKALIQQMWIDQLKKILTSQDHSLQKIKDRDTLRKWRRETEQLQLQKYQHNWQGLMPPHDFDAACLKMITRAGLHKFQNESLEKRHQTKPPLLSVKVLDFEDKVKKLLVSFDNMRERQKQELSDLEPAKRRQLLAEEMEKVRKLQQAVQALRLSI